MSRDLVEETYYISNGGKIPVKWTAPEVSIASYSIAIREDLFINMWCLLSIGTPLQEVLYSQ